MSYMKNWKSIFTLLDNSTMMYPIIIKTNKDNLSPIFLMQTPIFETTG